MKNASSNIFFLCIRMPQIHSTHLCKTLFCVEMMNFLQLKEKSRNSWVHMNITSSYSQIPSDENRHFYNVHYLFRARWLIANSGAPLHYLNNELTGNDTFNFYDTKYSLAIIVSHLFSVQDRWALKIEKNLLVIFNHYEYFYLFFFKNTCCIVVAKYSALQCSFAENK